MIFFFLHIFMILGCRDGLSRVWDGKGKLLSAFHFFSHHTEFSLYLYVYTPAWCQFVNYYRLMYCLNWKYFCYTCMIDFLCLEKVWGLLATETQGAVRLWAF